MTEPNYPARNRAIAEQLMEWHEQPVYSDSKIDYRIMGWFDKDGKDMSKEGWGLRFEPHSDPVAFDRLVKELKKICRLRIEFAYSKSPPDKIIDGVFLNKKNGENIVVKVADDYKEALVLAVTEEGTFCPVCGHKLYEDGSVNRLVCTYGECKARIHKPDAVPARVRPEIVK